MSTTGWPTHDRAWAARYRAMMAAKHVPATVLDARERELLAGALEAALPAEALFGPAHDLASEDAAELSTAEAAVLTAEGGGARVLVRELGGTLTGIALVGSVLAVVRGGWTVDLDIAGMAIAAGVITLAVAWVTGRALFSAGRSRAAVAAVAACLALAVACIAYAANLGGGHLLAAGAPTALVAAAALAPGVALLVISSRMPQPTLRERWVDQDWLHRFRGALRARLVAGAVARGHVAEIEHGIAQGRSAFAEYGHPLVLAREIADTDRGARARRWWVSVLGGTAFPAMLAALIGTAQSWGPLTIPVVAVLGVVALISLAVAWGDRPWARR